MGIRFNEQNKLFNIESKSTSYVLSVLETGHLVHLYWGRKINSDKINYLIKKRQCGSFLADLDNIDNFHLEAVPQEYPSYGNPDLRSPAVQVKLGNGTTITDFRYDSHKIFKGKNKLQGLPATYVEDDNEAQTLANNGYKEVVLTGIHVASYGKDLKEEIVEAKEGSEE